MFYWSRKTFDIWGWWLRIWKKFETTRTNLFEKGEVRTIFETECFFNLFLEVSQIQYFGTIQIGIKNWDLETYRKSLKKNLFPIISHSKLCCCNNAKAINSKQQKINNKFWILPYTPTPHVLTRSPQWEFMRFLGCWEIQTGYFFQLLILLISLYLIRHFIGP